jgi:membrane protease YdiL (CAAX protease family)
MMPDSHGAVQNTIVRFFAARKLLGLLLFFVIPLFISLLWHHKVLAALLVFPGSSAMKILLISLAGLVIIPVTYFTSRSEKVYGMYPEMRHVSWNTGLFLISAAGWLIYNFSYEFMFRGFLLQECLPLGTVNAILINLAMYSLLHLNKGWQEAVGAIPFGLILCLVTIYTGTFITSAIIHTILSVSTEYFSIRYNPGMSFIRSGT